MSYIDGIIFLKGKYIPKVDFFVDSYPTDLMMWFNFEAFSTDNAADNKKPKIRSISVDLNT